MGSTNSPSDVDRTHVNTMSFCKLTGAVAPGVEFAVAPFVKGMGDLFPNLATGILKQLNEYFASNTLLPPSGIKHSTDANQNITAPGNAPVAATSPQKGRGTTP